MAQQFLDDTVLMRTSVELTYAHHAPTTLKTATGRALALERSRRTRRFYSELLEEWSTIGLGAFDIVEEEIAGVVCVLVVPRGCGCGGAMQRPRASESTPAGCPDSGLPAAWGCWPPSSPAATRS